MFVSANADSILVWNKITLEIINTFRCDFRDSMDIRNNILYLLEANKANRYGPDKNSVVRCYQLPQMQLLKEIDVDQCSHMKVVGNRLLCGLKNITTFYDLNTFEIVGVLEFPHNIVDCMVN